MRRNIAEKHHLEPIARVLVVDDDPTARLTLQTLLTASGYHVEAASCSQEAFDMLEQDEYELVLSDLQRESPEVGRSVLAHARQMQYEPATAVLTSFSCMPSCAAETGADLLVEPQDVPELLGHVADLIGSRATRLAARWLRERRN